MLRQAKVLACAALATAFLIVSCANNPSAVKADQQGSLSIALVAAQGSTFSTLAKSAKARVTADDIDTMWQTLTVTSTSVSGTISGILAGDNRKFEIFVYDSTNSVCYYGKATTSVIGGTNVSVPITVYRYAGTGGAVLTGSIVDSVQSTNIPPKASITSPANGATYKPGDSLVVIANATDTDGTVARVQFYQDSVLIGTDTVKPYQLTVKNLVLGSHSYYVIATDNLGATTKSAIVSVVVQSAPVNKLPVVTITAPANNASYKAGDTVTITATATDSDGTIASVKFYRDSSVALGTVTASPYQVKIIGISAGSYNLYAVATDNQGGTTKSGYVLITVAPSPTTITIDDTALSYITYSGFTAGTRTGTYNGEYHSSATTGAYYTVTFTGTQAQIYAAKNTYTGIASFSVDGGTAQNVDLYSATSLEQQLYFNTGTLTNAKHTVKVTVTGTKNASSGGYWVECDKIVLTQVSTYIISYNLNGGVNSGSNPTTYTSTSSTITLQNPTNPGYTFGGWYTTAAFTGSAVTSVPTGSTGNLVFYAKWTANSYTVTFNGNGATTNASPSSIVVTVPATTVGTLPTPPSWNGYSFVGWNTAANGSGTAFTATTAVSANVTVYAQWTAISYTITYNLNGGTNGSNPASYTAATPPITLANPTNTGCTFGGWYTNAAFTGSAVTSIPTGSTGNLVFFAKWTVTDFDGNVYTTVTIGSQTWMVQNLRTKRYNDGTPIPLVTDSIGWSTLTSPGCCYYGNDSVHNASTYGLLYNSYAANSSKIAPAGWHVATDAEWDTMTTYLVAHAYNYDSTTTGNKVAKSLAAATNWNSSTVTGAVGNNLTQNNKSGFSALPGGYRMGWNGTFYTIGAQGEWWGVNGSSTNAFFLGSDNYSTGQASESTTTGLSIRLIKG